jgi:peptidoglycan/LPS O-acetylase OafA/YrhL
MNPGNAPRYETLDALRGLAALAIFVLHLDAFHLHAGLVPGAYLGVDLFFVLSGFVITIRYEPRMRGGFGAAAFAACRARTLYPVFALGLTAGFLVQLAAAGGDDVPLERMCDLIGRYLRSLAGLPDLDSHLYFPLNPVFWSLFLEVIANALHLLVLWRMRTRWLVAVAATAGAVLAVEVVRHGSLDIGHTHGTMTAGLARVLFGYTTGIVLARLHAAGRLPRATLGTPTLLLAFAALISLTPPAGTRAAFDLFGGLVVAPALIALSVGATLPAGARGALLALGRVSYPLYALHVPLFVALLDIGRIVGAVGVRIDPAVFSVLVVFATLQLVIRIADRLEQRARPAIPAAPRPKAQPSRSEPA